MSGDLSKNRYSSVHYGLKGQDQNKKTTFRLHPRWQLGQHDERWRLYAEFEQRAC